MKILITGGAGFVGASLACAFKRQDPSADVVVLDNLRRRGAELNLSRFRELGIRFFHGDIRCPGDLEDLPGTFDAFIEASAEPSVLAGLDGSPRYVLDTNLVGTLNCLEFARKRSGGLIFLSTSRVYSIEPLREIRYSEGPTRFEISPEQVHAGIGPAGISESFTTLLPRSLYGATKLASELIIQEYVHSYKMRAVINRCGVIAGPGQFGKVDQGVFTLWVANHYFKKPLRYTGFGGTGKQVRDLLHPEDLFSLLTTQLSQLDRVSGQVFNVGGGREISTSLLELSRVCEQVTGNTIPIASDPTTNPVDIPLYISDSSLAQRTFGWKPTRDVRAIVGEIAQWIGQSEALLRPLFA
ncbi:NAD-dependent epimerase/dehydratase family protein [Archangium violaceum]|uniref:NAD-dependent epimerase/dehydratase family protein n=1 Tax=Archangium violaceum TaxID=83451 RepID=UPI00193C4549|nr:NAD-dependent epimerase/dehydratase family protein [Archangium violaceum]QRK05650.1 NAD-dependent epimerase/dehydratase family protein [Archangium violaceum]